MDDKFKKLLQIDNYLEYKKEPFYKLLRNFYEICSRNDMESLEFSYPNENLINALVDSLSSINEFELIMALDKISQIQKGFPINISHEPLTSKEYRILGALISSDKKKENKFIDKFVNKNDLFNIFNLSSDLEKIEYYKAVCSVMEFIDSIIHKTTQNLLENYAQKINYIMSLDDKLSFIKWDINENIEEKVKTTGLYEKNITAKVFDRNTKKELSEIIISIFLENNEDFQTAFASPEIDCCVLGVNYRFIKSEWKERYFKKWTDDYTKNFVESLPRFENNNLTEKFEHILYNSNKYTAFDILEVLKNIHKHEFERKKEHELSCECCKQEDEKGNEHKTAFPANRLNLRFCPVCKRNKSPELNKLRIRLSRE